MGKNTNIRTIAKLIAGLTAHELLIRHVPVTSHLTGEIDNYRTNLSDEILNYNWSNNDINRIRLESLKGLKIQEKDPHFKGISYTNEEKMLIFNQIFDEFSKEALGK